MQQNITIIPPNMLPKDGRFGSGPSKIRTAHIENLKAENFLLGTSHRKDPIKNRIQQIKTELTKLLDIPQNYEIVLGNGGATAFWNIANFCLIKQNAQQACFGEFGKKFANTTTKTPFLATPQIIESQPGKAAYLQANPLIDTYATVQNETSTGVAVNIVHPDRNNENALLLVDATSAAGGMPINISNTDAYYFSLQKNFGAEGGIWFAILSPQAQKRASEIQKSGRWIPEFLDLNIALTESKQNQTYNTPALTTLLLFLEQLKWLNRSGGMPWVKQKTQSAAQMLYNWAENREYAYPFVTNPKERSNTIVTIDIAECIPTSVIANTLRKNNIVDIESYRKLGRNQIRIATFPSIEIEDIKALTECIDYVVNAIYSPK